VQAQNVTTVPITCDWSERRGRRSAQGCSAFSLQLHSSPVSCCLCTLENKGRGLFIDANFFCPCSNNVSLLIRPVFLCAHVHRYMRMISGGWQNDKSFYIDGCFFHFSYLDFMVLCTVFAGFCQTVKLCNTIRKGA
jgi:hypothetical protein